MDPPHSTPAGQWWCYVCETHKAKADFSKNQGRRKPGRRKCTVCARKASEEAGGAKLSEEDAAARVVTRATQPARVTHVDDDPNTWDDDTKRAFIASLPNPMTWSVRKVGEWLKDQDLERMQYTFAAQHVNGEMLLNLTRDDLTQLGVRAPNTQREVLTKIDIHRQSAELARILPAEDPHLPRDPRTWGVDMVCAWLASVGAAPLWQEQFRQQRVTGRRLLLLTDVSIQNEDSTTTRTHNALMTEIDKLKKRVLRPAPPPLYASDARGDRHPQTWDVDMVCAWLADEGMGHMQKYFSATRMNGKDLLAIKLGERHAMAGAAVEAGLDPNMFFRLLMQKVAVLKTKLFTSPSGGGEKSRVLAAPTLAAASCGRAGCRHVGASDRVVLVGLQNQSGELCTVVEQDARVVDQDDQVHPGWVVAMDIGAVWKIERANIACLPGTRFVSAAREMNNSISTRTFDRHSRTRGYGEQKIMCHALHHNVITRTARTARSWSQLNNARMRASQVFLGPATHQEVLTHGIVTKGESIPPNPNDSVHSVREYESALGHTRVDDLQPTVSGFKIEWGSFVHANPNLAFRGKDGSGKEALYETHPFPNPHPNPKTWSVQKVGEWLKDHDLENLQASFAAHHVDGEMLLTLTRDKLNQTGYSEGKTLRKDKDRAMLREIAFMLQSDIDAHMAGKLNPNPVKPLMLPTLQQAIDDVRTYAGEWNAAMYRHVVITDANTGFGEGEGKIIKIAMIHADDDMFMPNKTKAQDGTVWVEVMYVNAVTDAHIPSKSALSDTDRVRIIEGARNHLADLGVTDKRAPYSDEDKRTASEFEQRANQRAQTKKAAAAHSASRVVSTGLHAGNQDLRADLLDGMQRDIRNDEGGLHVVAQLDEMQSARAANGELQV